MKELTIEETRENLNNMLDIDDAILCEGPILKLSQDLDKLINAYYAIGSVQFYNSYC